MSIIDQAFIKAYAQPPKEKAPPSEAKCRKKAPRKPSSLTPAIVEAGKKPPQAISPRPEKKTPAKKPRTGKSGVKKNVRSQKADQRSGHAAEVTYRLDPPQQDLPAPRRIASRRVKGDRSKFHDIKIGTVPSTDRDLPTNRDLRAKLPLALAAPAADFAPPEPQGLWQAGEPQGFRPALQVEYVTWPRDVARLESAAGAELDRVADCLENAGAQGKILLGFASFRPGEGVTTLLIAVAKRMAERGRRLLLADADAATPQLARRLGILPQIGWEEVLLGRQTLAEAAVESIREGIVVLPLRNPLSQEVWDTEGNNRWQEIRQSIRGHFDFGLVDLGSWERSPWTGGADQELRPAGLDAVWLVCHSHKTSMEELLDIQKQFLLAGTPVLGVVENYVRELLATSAKTI
jgi:Mrp family chromosome partitioning ATPase